MAEAVFNTAQIAPQAGTFAAPGATVAAITILPVTDQVEFELDRATQYPAEDYGRNIKNHAGRGYHGVRGATGNLNGEWTFEQAMHLLEMHFAGGIVPTGTDPYTWGYALEALAPTLIPYTVEWGTETTQDQWEAQGVLVDELTVGFTDIDAPGAHPWTFEASCMALNKTVASKTGSLGSTAIETMQGIYTTLLEGTTATAFASLAEIAASLKGFSMTTRRSLTFRAYGGSSDTPTGYGFSEKTTGEISARIKAGATSKSNIFDIWNASGSVEGERRWRLHIAGSGTKVADLDMRVGFFDVNMADVDGERVYDVTAEIVDDSTLNAGAKWTIVNSIADLTP